MALAVVATATAAAGPARSSYFGYGEATYRNAADGPSTPKNVKDAKGKTVDEHVGLVFVIGMQRGAVTTISHGAGTFDLETLHTGSHADMEVSLDAGFKGEFKDTDVVESTVTAVYVVRELLWATAQIDAPSMTMAVSISSVNLRCDFVDIMSIVGFIMITIDTALTKDDFSMTILGDLFGHLLEKARGGWMALQAMLRDAAPTDERPMDIEARSATRLTGAIMTEGRDVVDYIGAQAMPHEDKC